MAVLLGEEADEESAGEFIGLGQKAVDAPMLLGSVSVGMPQAVRAFTAMQDTASMFIPHRR
jgi:hypothetical protein